MLGRRTEVAEVVGVDQGSYLLAEASKRAADLANVKFWEADARSLPFEDASFDVVVFDSVLSHIPDPEAALVEAYRILRPRGCLALFDGDYATTTVALGQNDPLQACADAMMASSVHDRWVVRRFSALVRQHGFEVVHARSHGFLETGGSGYMLTVVERGADILCSSALIGEETAIALKAEARRRAEKGVFFGHIAYGSLVSRKA